MTKSKLPVTAADLRALDQKEYNRVMKALGPAKAEELKYNWRFWAREDQIQPEGDWRVWLLNAGRGFGKALDVDTPVPTPDGWRTMGELREGHKVYDENGNICSVIVAHEPFISEETYKVNFSDGTHLVACKDHLWVTLTALERKQINRTGQVIPEDWASKDFVTTKNLFETQAYGKRGDRNHSIPLTKPIQGSDKNLLIDPYCLGYWLGDGHSNEAAITTADVEVTDYFRQAGYPCVKRGSQNSGKATTYSVGVKETKRCPNSGKMVSNGSFHTLLKELWVYGIKHIPDQYLKASPESRLALLQGMVDADGYVSRNCVEYCTTSAALAYGFMEIARSLGEKPVLKESRAKLYGKDCGPKFRITYRPNNPPARLPRKLSEYQPNGAQGLRNQHRMIVSVEPCEDTLVRCITVDSPNSMYLAGEGFIPTHNTRTGAEWVRERVKMGDKRIACVAPTKGDVRRVMVEGESGLLNICWSGDKTYRGAEMGYPLWSPTNNTLTWANGAKAEFFSAEDPERLRGPQFFSAWCDEIAAWRNMEEVWSMLQFCLRLGKNPKVCVTTTPKPKKLIRNLLSRCKEEPDKYILTTGSSYDNADNIDLEALSQFEGTRLGRQELYAEVLEEAAGALWNMEMLDNAQIYESDIPWENLTQIVVSVDPATTSNEESDMTGIVVAGVDINGIGYVLEDATLQGTPKQWGYKAVELFDKYKANYIVYESNQGGDMARYTLQLACEEYYGSQDAAPLRSVHASRGKFARAEPVSALYEQGRVKHAPNLTELEQQMVTWEPLEKVGSPDRLDSLVWAITKLMLGGVAKPKLTIGYSSAQELVD